MTSSHVLRLRVSPARRRSAAWLALGFAALVAAAACRPAPGATPQVPQIGAAAPDYSAMDMDGRPVTLASLKGKVVVLNVWATWCSPCRDEIPQLEALHQQYGAQGVEMIGVSIDAAGMGTEVAEFREAQHMTYPVWLDPDHDFSLKFLTIGVPETFVLDRRGTIRGRIIGALRPGDTRLVAAIRSALTS